MVSAIPFTNEKVIKRVTEAVLPYFDNNQDAVDGLFKTSPSSKSIQFFAVYNFAKDVTVFKSLWDSLMRSWFQNKENPASLLERGNGDDQDSFYTQSPFNKKL